MYPFITGAVVIVAFVILISLRQINQYERGIKFQFGKFKSIIQPGWRLVFPVVQSMIKIDIRVKVVDVPDQDAITKDNVSVNVNAVLYYKISEADKAILEVENFSYAVSQLAQTTMRDVVGEISLDELLANRDQTSLRIKQIVDEATDPWGIKIVSVELKHIELPQDMKRTIAKQAEAEREKRAVIIKAEGEVAAATNMSQAAKILSEAPGALHLRTLQSINDLSSDQSNTVIFTLPVEALRALEGLASIKDKK